MEQKSSQVSKTNSTIRREGARTVDLQYARNELQGRLARDTISYEIIAS